MATIIGCTESHYEAQKLPYGKAYVSYPQCVMMECDCGKGFGANRLRSRLPVPTTRPWSGRSGRGNASLG
jgi:hypothetical protein